LDLQGLRDSMTGILSICLYLLQTLLFIMLVFCEPVYVSVSCNKIVRGCLLILTYSYFLSFLADSDFFLFFNSSMYFIY